MSAAPPFLLVAGPPLGPAAWHGASARLQAHGHACSTVDLLDLPAGDLRALGAALRDRAHELPIDGVVVAQGTAVAVAMEALQAGLRRRLVLTNGPVSRADWALRLVGPLVRSPAGRAILHRAPVQAALASSAGGRRLVVNPYVMGRDTVASTTSSAFSSPTRRGALRRLLAELSTWQGRPVASPPPVLLLWGDEDPLYPAIVADGAGALIPGARHERIPGGQHLHLLERPWALADAARAWAAATPMS